MFLGTPAFNIIMTILAIVATLGAGYGLFLLVRRIEKKYREELDVLSEDFVPKNELKSVVDTYINRVGQFGSFAMFLIDIDDFSGINEAVGKERGDRILREFAHRIQRKFSRTAIISRYGADQIFVLEKSDIMFAELDAVASDLNEIIREPFEVAHGDEISITASVGIVLYPTCGTNFKDLAKSLEIATFVSKREGGNNYRIYHADMEAQESTNLEYYREVRKGIANKEFCLHYQPIIDINEKKVYGFEAFLRWNHPTLGVLTPNKFIHILERTGDINYISKWGLEQIILRHQELTIKLGQNDLCYAYNLSTKQLSSDTIVPDYRQLISKYRIDPARITLEIEEYALFEKLDVVKRNILKLKDLGFGISIDGLGLDYNTLTTLEKQPINTVKLDRQFLEDMEDNFMEEKIVGLLVESSEKFGRDVIQEGIENFQQIEYIQKQGIKYAQGYYFSVPLADKEMLEYIDGGSYITKLDPSIHHFAYGEEDEDETKVKDEEVVENAEETQAAEAVESEQAEELAAEQTAEPTEEPKAE